MIGYNKEVNGLRDLVQHIQELKAAEEERRKSPDAKLEPAIPWMTWAVG